MSDCHGLLVGKTQSGKTTLAKQMILKARSKGIKSIVLDILCDPGYNADFSTDNETEFLRMVWSSRRCLVIVDESGEAVGQYNKAMFALATRGRHWGHMCFFLTQKPTQLNPLIREQATNLFCFKAGHKSGILLAEDFVNLNLKNCPALEMGEYMHVNGSGKMTKGDIFQEVYGFNKHKGEKQK